ncbi:MAG: hypothetical protein C3F17_03245 [Bradyrhizobiaceae bacterium]|nr:MAG: hypothetical protein C3F17_03245 [Bradyrhizobiaceae bacterium]
MGGGAGTGLLVAFGLASLVAMPHRLIGLAALALVATGLFLVWLEIGRPWRFLNVLRHPQRSWMTREALVAAFLFPLGALGLWYGHPALVGAAAITGLGFLYCQARILTAARGIPAWRVPAIVPLIVSTGLAEGAGLFLALGALLQPPAAATTLVAGALLALVVLRALAWLGYRAALARDGAPTATLDALGRVSPWLWLPGTALPVPILAAGLVTADFVPWLWLGGLAAFAAGWVLKLVLITRAAFNQGFALAHTPARGAGPAGPPVKPGWTFRPAAVVPH